MGLGERDPDWIVPAWRGSEVGALMSTRVGGASAAPFDSLNLKLDGDPAAGANRARFTGALDGAQPVWLDQVHGTRVLRLTAADVTAPVQRADASVTSEPGIACTVMVADCLPVLFAAPQGRSVGAAHAGWRGLAAGVLQATLHEVCAAAGCRPGEVQAWLGPCIGPDHFEVGDDVVEAFGGPSAAFRPRHVQGKWFADLPMLARERLAAAGVTDVTGGAWCTVNDASRFFSFRRDRVTGRMAAAVWIRAR